MRFSQDGTHVVGQLFVDDARVSVIAEESVWYTVSNDFIVKMSGTGTVSMDSKLIDETIVENDAAYTLSNTSQTKYFNAEDTIQVRFNLTGDVSVTLIIS